MRLPDGNNNFDFFSESTFVTSGADSKLKRWIIENGELRNSHVGNYRDDPILNFDISEDGTTGK